MTDNPYDGVNEYDDYDGDYDPRTYAQKVVDDNTWKKDTGIAVDRDGRPYLYWCKPQGKVVQVREIEGSTVFDRYNYILCDECGANENEMRDPTEAEQEQYFESQVS